MFYAKRTDGYHTWTYAFANRRVRDLVVHSVDGLEATTAREAYHAQAEERRDAFGRFSHIDMRIPEYWEDEFAPLFGDAMRLDNFGPFIDWLNAS